MRRRLLLFPGAVLLLLGLILLGTAGVRTTSARENVTQQYGFEVTSYFRAGETIYVSVLPNQKWGKVITMDVEVGLNFSFITSDGGWTNLTAYYLAAPAGEESAGGMYSAPSMDLENVSGIVSSGGATLSDEASVATDWGLVGGIVQRDGNLTVALDEQSVFRNFMSTDSPIIVLRKSEPVFPYSCLSPFGIVSVVLSVPFLVFGIRRKKERRRPK
jgi:hypothetical protein